VSVLSASTEPLVISLSCASCPTQGVRGLPDPKGRRTAQTRGGSLRPYETLLLVDPRRTDQEIDETVARFGTLVSERGGEMSNIERWGRRRLAYEIEGLTEGYYAVCNY